MGARACCGNSGWSPAFSIERLSIGRPSFSAVKSTLYGTCAAAVVGAVGAAVCAIAGRANNDAATKSFFMPLSPVSSSGPRSF